MRKTGLICAALVAIYFATGARYENAVMPAHAGGGEVCSSIWSIGSSQKLTMYPDGSGYWFIMSLPGCAEAFGVNRSPPFKEAYKKSTPEGALKKIGGDHCAVSAKTEQGNDIEAFATSEKLCNALLFALTNQLPAQMKVTAKGIPPKDLSDVTKLPLAVGIEHIHIPLTKL